LPPACRHQGLSPLSLSPLSLSLSLSRSLARLSFLYLCMRTFCGLSDMCVAMSPFSLSLSPLSLSLSLSLLNIQADDLADFIENEEGEKDRHAQAGAAKEAGGGREGGGAGGGRAGESVVVQISSLSPVGVTADLFANAKVCFFCFFSSFCSFFLSTQVPRITA